MTLESTKANEDRVAAYFHYSLDRCCLCGELYVSDEEIWEMEAKEIYSAVPGKFPNGVVRVRAHTACWKLNGEWQQ